MRNKRFIQIVAIILAALMVVSVLIASLSNISARAVTKSQIDALKEQKKIITDKQKAVQSEINSLKYSQLSAIAKKTVLDNRISLTEDEIDKLIELIAVYNDLIGEKELEVIAAEARENTQLSLYKRRLRDMEENGSISYIAVVFDAVSFADLLARIDFVGDIMQSDEQAYEELVIAKNETIAAKQQLEATRDEQELEKADLVSKQLELQDQVEEAIELLLSIEADLDTATALWEDFEKDRDKLDADIAAKTAELRRQEAAAAAAGKPSSTVNGSGSLMWPGTSNVVTSLFGTRLHPVHKVYRTHYGIDLRAAYGSNVYAADGGTIITAAYSSSYGNYVVIDHGSNGMTTLYAHMSKLNVKNGQSVKKGDIVGFAGNSGTSTATHLHFEVSVNGVRQDPLNYFSGGYIIKDDA